MKYDRQDIIREFEFEDARCNMYTKILYQLLQFAFAAIVAIAVFALGKDVQEKIIPVVLLYILPICVYIFGTLFAFNAYALAVCGERAEKLHELMIQSCLAEDATRDDNDVMDKYVVTNSNLSAMTYVIPLTCILLLPLVCILIGAQFCFNQTIFVARILPWLLYVTYALIMFIVVYHTKKHYVKTKNKKPTTRKKCFLRKRS